MLFSIQVGTMLSRLALAAKFVAQSIVPERKAVTIELRNDGVLEFKAKDFGGGYVQATHYVKLDGARPGSVVVYPKLLSGWLANLKASAEVSVRLANNRLELTCGSSVARFVPLALDALHPPTTGQATAKGEIQAKDLKRLVIATRDATVPSPVVQPSLGVPRLVMAEGVLHAVATDKVRLHRVGAAPPGVEFSVPSAVLDVLTMLPDGDAVECETDGEFVRFKAPGVELVTPKVIGDFVPWRALVDRFDTLQPSVKVSKANVLSAIKSCRVLAGDTAAVDVRIQGESMEFTVDGDEQAGIEIPVVYTGERMEKEATAKFNPRYLLDAVEASPGDEITLTLQAAGQPVVLRSGDLFALVQQMRST